MEEKKEIITLPDGTRKEIKIIPEKGHYETAKEYTKQVPIYDENGNQTGTEIVVTGREVKWVWDDQEEIKNEFRRRRGKECFPIINRGQLWYNTLNEIQLAELEDWYNAWLNVTETLVPPLSPEWLKL